MWPVVGKIVLKGALKIGGAVLAETAAKELLNKFTEKTKADDCLNKPCPCGGVFMLGDEHDQHDGLIVCTKCTKKKARYIVTKHKTNP